MTLLSPGLKSVIWIYFFVFFDFSGGLVSGDVVALYEIC